jgi:hypothetical protein
MLARCYSIYRLLVAGVAAVLFLVCLGMHVCTMVGVELYFYAQFLNVGFFLGIPPVALAIGSKTTDVAGLSRNLPWWSFGLLLLLFVYTVIIGPILSWPPMPFEGTAWPLEDGTYGVFNRSTFLRPCSVEEYYLRHLIAGQHITRFAMFVSAVAFAAVVAAMWRDHQQVAIEEERKLVSSLVAPLNEEFAQPQSIPKRSRRI